MSPKKQCLLLEDRTEDALLIKKHLAEHGDFGLQWVMDGEEAMYHVKRSQESGDAPALDLILLDLRLPRLDGFAFLEWWRRNHPNRSTPVMVLTCSTESEDIRRAHGLGVSTYLTKPVDWTRFGQELKRLAVSGGAPKPAAVEARSRFALPPPVRWKNVTHIVTLPNGNKIKVSASAQFEDQVVPFLYEGDTSMFRPFAEKGTLGFLKWYLQAVANHLGADVEMTETPVTGQF